MANLTGDFGFTGKLGNISAYRLKGTGEIILRTKGGATRQKIRTSPKFENTRKINIEWDGVAKAASAFRHCIYPLYHLADMFYTGACNQRVKAIQQAGTAGRANKRPILFSAFPYLMEGFNLNRNCLFESVVSHPFSNSINRNELSAVIDVPALVPGINFKNPGKHPYYRMIFVLGLLSDWGYDERHKRYLPMNQFPGFKDDHETEWLSDKSVRPPERIELTIQPSKPFELKDHTNLILAMGIEFGTSMPDGKLQFVKYAGCGKLLCMG